MELKSCTYATVTTLGDFGPWISKVVLDLPCTVRANDVNEHTFNIYCARHERAGEVLMRKEHGADHAAPCRCSPPTPVMRTASACPRAHT